MRNPMLIKTGDRGQEGTASLQIGIVVAQDKKHQNERQPQRGIADYRSIQSMRF